MELKPVSDENVLLYANDYGKQMNSESYSSSGIIPVMVMPTIRTIGTISFIFQSILLLFIAASVVGTIIEIIVLGISKKKEKYKKDLKFWLIIICISIVLFIITWVIGIIFKDVELL